MIINTISSKPNGRVYLYARISTPHQSIERQIRNGLSVFPNAIVVKETFTGTKMERPEWNKLYRTVSSGDTIIFDSVSRMSRTSSEGIEIYFELYEKGIELIFLNESYINTSVYREALANSIQTTGNEIADLYIEATNKVIRILAKEQIKKAFDQAQKEVDDLHERTRQGMETARLNGKQIGQKKGAVLHIKKKEPSKEKILKYSRDFYGYLTDIDCIKLIQINRNTYYKYKKELKEELGRPGGR